MYYKRFCFEDHRERTDGDKVNRFGLSKVGGSILRWPHAVQRASQSQRDTIFLERLLHEIGKKLKGPYNTTLVCRRDNVSANFINLVSSGTTLDHNRLCAPYLSHGYNGTSQATIDSIHHSD